MSSTTRADAPATATAKKQVGSVNPQLIISRTEADQWVAHNPHARPGVLEDLAAAGVIHIADPPKAVSKMGYYMVS